MLIAIEGIDGAGKTTACDGLVDGLRGMGLKAQALRKSDIAFGHAFADSRLRQLQGVIWPSQAEPGEDVLGTHFYLYLLAAWFSALSNRVEVFAGHGEDICVVDGSHFRVMAKAHLRAGLDLEFLHQLFAHVVQPDLVVLLDAEPDLVWHRRTAFKDTEIGRWDGFAGDRRAAFCNYQSKVRGLLTGFAEQHDWRIVRQGAETTVQDVVESLADQVRSSLRHLKGQVAG